MNCCKRKFTLDICKLCSTAIWLHITLKYDIVDTGVISSMHFICLRHKFRVAAFNRIFFAWNITTNLFRRVDGGLLFHNAHCIAVTPSNCEFLVGSCYVIDLQVSLVCPRSFICLRYVLALGRRKRVVCYNVFSLFDRPGRSRPLDGNISRNRNMRRTCYAYMQTGRENRGGTLHRVGSVNSWIYCVSTYTEINLAWITSTK